MTDAFVPFYGTGNGYFGCWVAFFASEVRGRTVFKWAPYEGGHQTQLVVMCQGG